MVVQGRMVEVDGCQWRTVAVAVAYWLVNGWLIVGEWLVNGSVKIN